MDNNTILRTPKDWSRDTSFMGLQLLEEPSDQYAWENLKVLKEQFVGYYLKNIKHNWYVSKL